MRSRQRVKTVPFARLRQAANCACVVARELRRMQSGLGSFCETAEMAADPFKAIASNRLLDGPASPA
jgi:uroporphyrinogen-III decarboxylase